VITKTIFIIQDKTKFYTGKISDEGIEELKHITLGTRVTVRLYPQLHQ
jgi:hypothetical protein